LDFCSSDFGIRGRERVKSETVKMGGKLAFILRIYPDSENIFHFRILFSGGLFGNLRRAREKDIGWEK